MCTISFDKEALNITIHNLYPGLELTSPVYFGNGTTCHVSPSQQTGIGTKVESSFGIDFKQKDAKGALLHRLQRKHITRIDNQPNSSTVSIEDMATNTYLLVVWDVGNVQHNFYACLIECTNDFTWDEDKLWALYKEYVLQFNENCKSNIITWLMNDSVAMKTKLDVTYGTDYKLDVIIFEGAGKYHMEKLIQIDPKRLVLSLSILIVLIYAVSLSIQPSIKLDIHNQCLNVDLVSPTYIIGDALECHRAPDRKVCAGDTMRSGFIINKPGNESDGALIYRLQRKGSRKFTEIDESTLNTIQFLIIWRTSESKKLCVDAMLVEHDKGLDKDNLKELRRKNINRFKLCPDSAIETWLLDANTALMTTSKIMNEDRILNVTISEVEEGNSTRIPSYIDPER
jgi:hypothetical protein